MRGDSTGSASGLLAVALVASLGLAAPAGAGRCHLAMAFGLDVTGSLSDAQVDAMRAGLAGALREPALAAELRAVGAAIYIYEWSDRSYQRTLVGWESDPVLAAERLEAAPPRRRGATAYGEAMLHGYRAVQAVGCWDGVLNMIIDGFGARDAYVGIGAEGARAQMDPWFSINAVLVAGEHLREVIEAEVIQGPFAFVELAEGLHDFAEAAARKIRREIAYVAPGGVR